MLLASSITAWRRVMLRDIANKYGGNGDKHGDASNM